MDVTNAAAVADTNVDAAKLTALLDKVLPFARAADAVARRLAGKVSNLALIGLVSGVWLCFACWQRFDLSAAALLPIAALILAGPLVLLKLASTLRSVIGLPQRVVDTGSRIIGKANEYRQLAAARQADSESRKPTLRELWSTGRSLLEVKGLTDESKEIVALAGSALAISNPLFAALLAITSIVTIVVIIIGVVVGLGSL